MTTPPAIRLLPTVDVFDDPQDVTLYETTSGRAYRLVPQGSISPDWVASLRGEGAHGDDEERRKVLDALSGGGFLEGPHRCEVDEPSCARMRHVLAVDVVRAGASTSLRRVRELAIRAEREDQGSLVDALWRGFEDAACDWRRIIVDVGRDRVGDDLLAIAEDRPVRVLVSDPTDEERGRLAASAADVCQVVTLGPQDSISDTRVDELADVLSKDGRTFALRIRAPTAPVPGDDAETWQRFFTKLRTRVADLELEGGGSAQTAALWRQAKLLPWADPMRRGWDTALLQRIARCEAATQNPTIFALWQRVFVDFASVVGPGLALPPGGRLADLCGGMGFGSLALRRSGAVAAHRACVFDLDEVAIAKGRDLRDADVNFRIANALRLPCAPATYDAALVVGAIDYFTADDARFRAFARECRRILRPGARLVIVHPLFWVTSAAQMYAHVFYPQLISILQTKLVEEGFTIEAMQCHGVFLRGKEATAMELLHLPTNRTLSEGNDFDQAPIIAYVVARRCT